MERFLFCLLLSALLYPITPTLFSKETDLKVMSFNIRLGVANDGDNHWDKRKESVLQTIQNFGPDLLGLQEVWHMQEDFLKEKLSDYSYFGRSRRTDPREGEQCGIMYRKNRFEKIEGKNWTNMVKEGGVACSNLYMIYDKLIR